MLKGQSYNSEFKREAVKLAQSSDKSLPVISEELGVNYKTLSRWVRESMNKPIKKQGQRTKEHHYQELLSENAKLKRELKRAQQERDILKKATVGSTRQSNTTLNNMLWCFKHQSFSWSII